jgi:hypothetical protein
MFDFGEFAMVPWNIAVYTASATLMICHLHSDLSDKDIVMELVQLGVPFHTLQKRISLNVVRDNLLCAMTPMVLSDHVFSRTNYTLWQQWCQTILHSQQGQAAVLCGGYVWHLASAEGVGVSEALKGLSGLHYNNALNFCTWDKDSVEYVDNDLMTDKLDLLCGIYQSFVGKFEIL